VHTCNPLQTRQDIGSCVVLLRILVEYINLFNAASQLILTRSRSSFLPKNQSRSTYVLFGRFKGSIRANYVCRFHLRLPSQIQISKSSNQYRMSCTIQMLETSTTCVVWDLDSVKFAGKACHGVRSLTTNLNREVRM